MRIRTFLSAASLSLLMLSCGNGGEDTATSTPTDSVNENGTAPVQYGGVNPANEQDTNLVNANDTGTKAQDKYEYQNGARAADARNTQPNEEGNQNAPRNNSPH